MHAGHACTLSLQQCMHRLQRNVALRATLRLHVARHVVGSDPLHASAHGWLPSKEQPHRLVRVLSTQVVGCSLRVRQSKPGRFKADKAKWLDRRQLTLIFLVDKNDGTFFAYKAKMQAPSAVATMEMEPGLFWKNHKISCVHFCLVCLTVAILSCFVRLKPLKRLGVAFSFLCVEKQGVLLFQFVFIVFKPLEAIVAFSCCV